MMQPVSILDQDFDEKIAHLPHAEARALVMEHAIRAQIHERLEQNPVFYERLSQRLARIIEQMRSQLIDAAEAYLRMAVLQDEVHTRPQWLPVTACRQCPWPYTRFCRNLPALTWRRASPGRMPVPTSSTLMPECGTSR